MVGCFNLAHKDENSPVLSEIYQFRTVKSADLRLDSPFSNGILRISRVLIPWLKNIVAKPILFKIEEKNDSQNDGDDENDSPKITLLNLHNLRMNLLIMMRCICWLQKNMRLLLNKIRKCSLMSCLKVCLQFVEWSIKFISF